MQVSAMGTNRAVFESLEPRELLTSDLASSAMSLAATSSSLFVANEGQWADASVRFALQADGATILYTDAGPVFLMQQGSGQDIQSTTFSVRFDGAASVSPVGLQQSQSRFNYFVGAPSAWRTNVPGYEKVGYEGLYDGVDLYTWGHADNLKYEFHVAPGADYRQISMSYAGIQGLTLDSQGAIHVATQLGELTDDAPRIYQVINGKEVAVAGAYELTDNDSYTFVITGKYDSKAELIIDPYLAWGSYIGGADIESATGVAVDADDNIVVSGSTASDGWMSGGYQTAIAGGSDAFVVKLSSDGDRLWSTYIGGSDDDSGNAIAIDNDGNILVAGQTFSAGWISGGYDTILNDGSGASAGQSDGFVVKLSSAGAYVWGTYLGDTLSELANGITVDSLDNVLVAGRTNSDSWVSGGFDTTYDPAPTNGSDGFVVKLTSAGNHVWSTYVGGNDEDDSRAIAVDSDDSVLVTGRTYSADWVSMGYDTSYNDAGDAYVVKLSSAGTHVWSTYVGGSDYDIGFGVAVDSLDNVVVVGDTASLGWTAGGFNTAYNGGWRDVFVAKLSSSGTEVWSTYLGGEDWDYGRGVTVDSNDNIVVAGGTESRQWVIGGFDTSPNHGDAFVAKISSAGGHFWSTYVGGAEKDDAFGIAIDSLNSIVIAGNTRSNDWFWGGYDSVYDGIDGFVAKITNEMGVLIGDGEAKSVTFTDADGTVVTVTITHGRASLHLVGGQSGTHRQLQGSNGHRHECQTGRDPSHGDDRGQCPDHQDEPRRGWRDNARRARRKDASRPAFG